MIRKETIVKRNIIVENPSKVWNRYKEKIEQRKIAAKRYGSTNNPWLMQKVKVIRQYNDIF